HDSLKILRVFAIDPDFDPLPVEGVHFADVAACIHAAVDDWHHLLNVDADGRARIDFIHQNRPDRLPEKPRATVIGGNGSQEEQQACRKKQYQQYPARPDRWWRRRWRRRQDVFRLRGTARRTQPPWSAGGKFGPALRTMARFTHDNALSDISVPCRI